MPYKGILIWKENMKFLTGNCDSCGEDFLYKRTKAYKRPNYDFEERRTVLQKKCSCNHIQVIEVIKK